MPSPPLLPPRTAAAGKLLECKQREVDGVSATLTAISRQQPTRRYAFLFEAVAAASLFEAGVAAGGMDDDDDSSGGEAVAAAPMAAAPTGRERPAAAAAAAVAAEPWQARPVPSCVALVASQGMGTPPPQRGGRSTPGTFSGAAPTTLGKVDANKQLIDTKQQLEQALEEKGGLKARLQKLKKEAGQLQAVRRSPSRTVR